MTETPTAEKLRLAPDEIAPPEPALPDGRASELGQLRARTARGTMINAAFQVGLASLNLIKRLVVVALLTASEFGFWGLLIASLATLMWLKEVGISDKYIQQSEIDQEAAFQKAFTLELLYSSAFFVALVVVALPLYALIYGRPEIIPPGLVLSLALLVSAFKTPIWIFYRRMEFVRQRSLAAVDPVVSFLVTVPLAAAGFGYWSLVIGAVAGSFLSALVAVRACPYRFAFRFDRGALKDYVSFSWPLVIVTGSGLVIVQASIIVGEATVGLVGVGVIALAGIVLRFVDQANLIVTTTLYPAVCAVRDRTDLLREAFTKSNRLVLMWAMPFGFGLTLFAPDLVAFVLGGTWEPAVGMLQVLGAVVALKQVGFNWTAFMRARGETRPLAVNGVLGMAAFLAIGVPLMYAVGLDGYVLGIAGVVAAQFLSRTYYLARLFPGFSIGRHLARAVAPSVPAVAAVLLVRALLDGSAARAPEIAVAELALYVAVTVAATMVLERPLIREAVGYLRGRQAGLVPAAE